MAATAAHHGTKHGAGRQSKSVTATYGAVSMALLVVIATVALIVKPPSPPALAEFAPQPDKTIDEGPDNQSSQFGSGAGGTCAAGQVGCEGIGQPPPQQDLTLDGLPRQRVVEQGRVKRCVPNPAGGPPLQIEDPQSPPCADYWEGPDNGGATSRGVTAHEIRVAASFGNLQFDSLEKMQSLAEFFNTRFEFYGRNIRLVRADDMYQQAYRQRAAADSAYELETFASLGFSTGGSNRAWRSRLAQHRIVSVSAADGHTSEDELKSWHPYAWSYGLTYDKAMRDLGQFACQGLLGELAEHGGLDVQGKQRKFAVVRGIDANVPARGQDPYEDNPGDNTPGIEALKACNAPLEVAEFRWGDNDPDEERMLADLSAKDVTTIIPTGDNNTNVTWHLAVAASKLNYQPEWLLPGAGEHPHLSELTYQTSVPAEQAGHMIAMGGPNKFMPPVDRPSMWAYQESGTPYPEPLWTSEANMIYQSLLVLASGIQAAGPRLTPETFARGLQGLKFPNPFAAAAPYYQGTVGFTGDHSMIDDEGVWWWSAGAQAFHTSRTQGGWCVVDRGSRWRTGRWPDRDYRLFDPTLPCR